MWNTTVAVGASGHENRNANWQDVMQKWNAAFSIRNKSDLETLIDFFNSVKGRETAFLVKDYANFQVRDWTEFTETLTGASQNFQPFKKHANALGTSYSRNIIKLPTVASNSKAVELIYDRGGAGETTPNAVASSPTAETEYTWDATTGIVTYDPPGTDTLEFRVGEFYFPARFDTDELPVEILFHSMASSTATATETSHGQIAEVPIIEVRV
jgi:uncharacterized protein (TIGR02217 family)